MSFTQTRLKANFRVKSSPHARYVRAVSLLLTQEQKVHFIEQLQTALNEGREYSFYLETSDPSHDTESWFFIFKTWDGESRFILSHPNHTEWVVTLALTSEHQTKLFETLKTDSKIELNSLNAVARVTNVQASIEIV
jgi:hypothetical protein